MKRFIACICIVAFIFGVIIVNSFFVRRALGDIIDAVDMLNEDFKSYERLKELWEKSRFLIGLSASAKETDKIDDMLSAIASLYKIGDFSTLEEKKALLINYIELISDHERVSIDNII